MTNMSTNADMDASLCRLPRRYGIVVPGNEPGQLVDMWHGDRILFGTRIVIANTGFECEADVSGVPGY